MDNPLAGVWNGEFGNAYIERCPADEGRVRRSMMTWANLLKRVAHDPPLTILEVGANVAANILALQKLTAAQLWALEPNARARCAQDHLTKGAFSIQSHKIFLFPTILWTWCSPAVF